MRAVRPRELGLPGMKRVVVVAPKSPREEVMPIGHSGQSQTFLPQVVQTTDEPNSAYCDCPGFYDTRGAEINIANAINIRKILQQATGVKAVFLAEYDELTADRGRYIQDLETMCRAMFGGVDNLRNYQNSVLIGITKAPLYEEDELLTTNAVRGQLLMGVNSDVATILADRIFLFDPLDRAIDNPDFWPIERFRTEIAQLEYIPQQQAVHLFQTTLTDSDKVHLLTTIRQLHAQIASAITQGDVTALGQHWQLLQRLRIIEHPEVHELIEGQVLPDINIAILQKANAVRSSANVLDFEDARRQLSELISIIGHLPGVPLACDINAIQKHIHDCKANKDNEDARQENLATLRAELAEVHKRLALVREQLDRTSKK
ncbi:MAG: hypothetical protein MUC61_00940 [Amoebophilaceae bacterium]|nr:hypothetical protein [Amoebophilaceae bacterium]